MGSKHSSLVQTDIISRKEPINGKEDTTDDDGLSVGTVETLSSEESRKEPMLKKRRWKNSTSTSNEMDDTNTGTNNTKNDCFANWIVRWFKEQWAFTILSPEQRQAFVALAPEVRFISSSTNAPNLDTLVPTTTPTMAGASNDSTTHPPTEDRDDVVAQPGTSSISSTTTPRDSQDSLSMPSLSSHTEPESVASGGQDAVSMPTNASLLMSEPSSSEEHTDLYETLPNE